VHHDVCQAGVAAMRRRAGALAIPIALACGLAAGAVPATAQTISAPPCAINLHGPTIDSPQPAFPVHGEGWTPGRYETLIDLDWPEGVLNDDGTRARESAGADGYVKTSAPTWDGSAELPAAFGGFPGRALPPGAYPFTLRATSVATTQPLTAQTSITLVQPGVTVQGVPRLTKKRGIVGRSRLTLWGVDPALNGRPLYGHILRDEMGREVKRFRAGVADADLCSPLAVPRKVKLLSRKAGIVQTIRFTDTKNFTAGRDIPHLSLEVHVNIRNGRTKVEPTFDATRRGVPLPEEILAPR
jgi:hypothetical protein